MDVYKWTSDESYQKEANKITKEMGVFITPEEKLLYHYTSREVFWKIIEEESFLARHILFSNDYQEQKIGRKKLELSINNELKEDKRPDLSEGNMQPYMICFCEQKDLLSQWRGYAQSGIAMEFDFTKGLYGADEGFSTYHCYTVMNNDTDKKALIEKCSSQVGKDQYVVLALASPYHVIYTDSNEKIDDKINIIIKNILENFSESVLPTILKIMPYIKHNMFQEEDEHRIIFDLEELIRPSLSKIRKEKNVYLEVNGVKKPNIRIMFCNVLDVIKEETTIYYGNLEYELALFDMVKEYEADGKKINLIHNLEQYPMKNNEILIGNSKYQEEIMYKLRQVINNNKSLFKNIKVWCDGHMPLRKIIVGPSMDAEMMKESVKQYRENKYWMEYVDVVTSEIPLRVTENKA